MQQRPIVSFAILALVFAAPCTRAQDMPDFKPAAELQKLAPLAGTWKGTGTYQASPDAAKVKWTVHEQAGWVLGGHSLEIRTHVTFADNTPPLTIRGLYGWDREARRHVMIACSSMGKVQRAHVDFPADGTMVIASIGTHKGQPYLSRETIRIGKDRYELRIENAEGAGPFFVEVEGTMERVTGAEGGAVPAEAGAAKPSSEIAKLQRLLGAWQVKGSMVPAPGAPSVEISGKETYELVHAGRVIQSHTVGDPVSVPGMPANMSYEGVSFVAWNEETRCYDWAFADSMGMIGCMRTTWADADTLVLTCSEPMMGQPCAARCVLTLGKEGQPSVRLASERLFGTAPMFKDFEATYTRAK